MQTDWVNERECYQSPSLEITYFSVDVITASSDDPYRDDGYGDLIWG